MRPPVDIIDIITNINQNTGDCSITAGGKLTACRKFAIAVRSSSLKAPGRPDGPTGQLG